MARPHTGAPASMVFPNFPYERKFTHAEIHGDILPRAKRIGDAMRDGVGPNGATLFIPGDMFELWMIHAALAGVDVHEDKAYIRARRLPDQSGRFADAVEWVIKREDTPAARAADAEREADKYIADMADQLRPEVREAIRRRFSAEAADAAANLADDPDAGKLRDDFGAPRLARHDEEGNQ
jgi:hypothetical protein